MYKNAEQNEIDNMVWSLIRDSTNPDDFRAFYRFSTYRTQFIKTALDHLILHQDNQSTHLVMRQAIDELTQLAEGGSNVAAFHVGRAHLWGIGVQPQTEAAVRYYTMGAERGDTRCMLTLGRLYFEENKAKSHEWLSRALDAGDHSAYCFLAEHNPDDYEGYLHMGSFSGEPVAVYFYAKYLVDQASCAKTRRVAMQEMRRAAQLGEGLACVALGYSYAFGENGQRVNLNEAEFYYRRAFDHGQEGGLAQFGRLLIAKRIDVPRGEVFLEHAALMGNVEAQGFLGIKCLNGSTTAEKKAKGVKWLYKAAEQNHGLSMYWLSNALQEGIGVKADPDEAIEWLQKGSEIGSVNCQTSLGLAHLHGLLIEQDKERAHHLFHLASLQGDTWATYLLGLTYELGDGVQVDHKAAIQCFEKSSADVPKSKYCLARIYYTSDSPDIQDLPKAIKWLKLAADDGIPEAQSMLGEIILGGVGVESNPSKAYEWFKLAADQGHGQANYQMAKLLMVGNGVKANMNLAIRHMMKAAANGVEEANEWIKTHLPAKPQWLEDLKQIVSDEDEDENSF